MDDRLGLRIILDENLMVRLHVHALRDNFNVTLSPSHINKSTDDLEVCFRPPWYGLALWFILCGGMLLFELLIVGPLLHAPGWVNCFFVGTSSLALLVGLILSFAFVRAHQNGLVNRHFTRWSASWTDVEAWSQLGPQGSVYLKTRDGRIRGFSSWCVYGVRCDRLARLLEQRVGPSRKGEAAIVPRLPAKRLDETSI